MSTSLLSEIDKIMATEAVRRYQDLKSQQAKIEQEMKEVRTILLSFIDKNEGPFQIEVDGIKYKVSKKEYERESPDLKILREQYSQVWESVKKKTKVLYPEVRKLKK